MLRKNTLKTLAITEEKSLKTLVENRTAYTLESCELNVFETHRQSALVPLTFPDFVVTSMLRGKKVMHLMDDPAFDYLPGETVLVPAGVTMRIDFPEASAFNPTQCIALAVDHHKIQQTLQLLNERYPRQGDGRYWQLHKNNYHFLNNVDLAQIINKIIQICTQDAPCKDILADLALQELIVNILQIQHLKSAQEITIGESNQNPLAYITAFVKAHITEEIRLETLSAKACMSKATFYRTFKREFGISPGEFILVERIKKAKRLLTETDQTIKSICFECGFSDVNYFVRLFRTTEGITPKQYQMMARGRG